MKSSLHDAGEEKSAAPMPSVLSIRSKNSKSSGSSVTTSTATTTKKDNSKKDKPLNETPEEKERRKKEKKERKEGKEHETPEEKAKRKEKRKKEKESKVSSTSTGISSPQSVIPEAETPEERSQRHKEKKEKKQRKKDKKERKKKDKKEKEEEEAKSKTDSDPSASKPDQGQSLSSSVSTPTNSNAFPNVTTKKADQRYSDVSSFYSSTSAAESATREATSSSSESSDHGDKMSVSVMTDPYFGPQQIKSDQQRSFLLHQQYQMQLQQQYQQQQEMQQMEQHQQYRQQLPPLQQHFQQAQPYTNRAISDSDYGEHVYMGNPALNGSSSIGPKGMLVDPNAASTVKSVMDDMSVCNDDEMNSVITGLTESNMEVTLHQQKFLLRMVKTMGRKVAKAEAKIRSLGERNFQMEELAVQLTKSEEQLEYASEDNNDYAVRVHALEQALLMQETELDNALETIRLQGETRRKEELRKAEREVKTSTNPFAEMTITDPFAEKPFAEEMNTNPFAEEMNTNPFAEEMNTNPFAEETTTNPFAGDEDDRKLATTREEVAAIREELAQLQQERDMAVERVTTVAIQLAELRADADESRDQLIETRAIMERLQAAKQQSSSNSLGSFLWAKKDAKSVMSTAADEAIDGTESTGSVSSSVAWPHSDHSGDAAYEVGRRHDEASYDLVL